MITIVVFGAVSHSLYLEMLQADLIGRVWLIRLHCGDIGRDGEAARVATSQCFAGKRFGRHRLSGSHGAIMASISPGFQLSILRLRKLRRLRRRILWIGLQAEAAHERGSILSSAVTTGIFRERPGYRWPLRDDLIIGRECKGDDS